jgi:hypothetical protein
MNNNAPFSVILRDTSESSPIIAVGVGKVSGTTVTIDLKAWEEGETNISNLSNWTGAGVYHVHYIYNSSPFGSPPLLQSLSVTFEKETTTIPWSQFVQFLGNIRENKGRSFATTGPRPAADVGIENFG